MVYFYESQYELGEVILQQHEINGDAENDKIKT